MKTVLDGNMTFRLTPWTYATSSRPRAYATQPRRQGIKKAPFGSDKLGASLHRIRTAMVAHPPAKSFQALGISLTPNRCFAKPRNSVSRIAPSLTVRLNFWIHGNAQFALWLVAELGSNLTLIHRLGLVADLLPIRFINLWLPLSMPVSALLAAWKHAAAPTCFRPLRWR